MVGLDVETHFFGWMHATYPFFWVDARRIPQFPPWALCRRPQRDTGSECNPGGVVSWCAACSSSTTARSTATRAPRLRASGRPGCRARRAPRPPFAAAARAPQPNPNPDPNPNPNPNPGPIPSLSFSPNPDPNQACFARAARRTTFGSRCGSVSATPTPGVSATQQYTRCPNPTQALTLSRCSAETCGSTRAARATSTAAASRRLGLGLGVGITLALLLLILTLTLTLRLLLLQGGHPGRGLVPRGLPLRRGALLHAFLHPGPP